MQRMCVFRSTFLSYLVYLFYWPHFIHTCIVDIFLLNVEIVGNIMNYSSVLYRLSPCSSFSTYRTPNILVHFIQNVWRHLLYLRIWKFYLLLKEVLSFIIKLLMIFAVLFALISYTFISCQSITMFANTYVNFY